MIKSWNDVKKQCLKIMLKHKEVSRIKTNVNKAIDFLKRTSNTLPYEIVYDDEGGIMISRELNNNIELIHIWDDGKIDRQIYRGCLMIKREDLTKKL